MNLVQQIENEEINRLLKKRSDENNGGIPDFYPGDTLRVSNKVTEGAKQRAQIFEGVCIARTGGQINQEFTVRKISFGEGVERSFALYSPNLGKIEIVKKGRVRRAKLYYLRKLRGKAARITEKRDKKKLQGEQKIN